MSILVYNDTQELPTLVNNKKNNHINQKLKQISSYESNINSLLENSKKNYSILENLQNIISKNNTKYINLFKKLENENKQNQKSIETIIINIADIQSLCKNITECTININHKLSQFEIENDVSVCCDNMKDEEIN